MPTVGKHVTGKTSKSMVSSSNSDHNKLPQNISSILMTFELRHDHDEKHSKNYEENNHQVYFASYDSQPVLDGLRSSQDLVPKPDKPSVNKEDSETGLHAHTDVTDIPDLMCNEDEMHSKNEKHNENDLVNITETKDNTNCQNKTGKRQNEDFFTDNASGVFIKEEIHSDTELMLNYYNIHDDPHNIPETSRTPKEDQVIPICLTKAQGHNISMHDDIEMGDTHLDSQLTSSYNHIFADIDQEIFASMKGKKLKNPPVRSNLPTSSPNCQSLSKLATVLDKEVGLKGKDIFQQHVSESDVESQEPSEFSPTLPRQSSDIHSKMRISSDSYQYHSATNRRYKSAQLNGHKNSDNTSSDDGTYSSPDSLFAGNFQMSFLNPEHPFVYQNQNRTGSMHLLSSSLSLHLSEDSGQDPSPSLDGHFLGKNPVDDENDQVILKRGDNVNGVHYSNILENNGSDVDKSDQKHKNRSKSLDFVEGIFQKENHDQLLSFLGVKDEENEKVTGSLVNKKQNLSTAKTTHSSNHSASYWDERDEFNDSEFLFVIDNAETDIVIEGNEAIKNVMAHSHRYKLSSKSKVGEMQGKEMHFEDKSLSSQIVLIEEDEKVERSCKSKQCKNDGKDVLVIEESTTCNSALQKKGIKSDERSAILEHRKVSSRRSVPMSGKTGAKTKSKSWKSDSHPCHQHESAPSKPSSLPCHMDSKGNDSFPKDREKDNTIAQSCTQNKNMCLSTNKEIWNRDFGLEEKKEDLKVARMNSKFNGEFSLNANNFIQRTQTYEKSFQCHKCDESFVESCHLHLHMRTHTGEKIFKCDKCEKCFNHRSSMQRHLKTHSEGKSAKCDKCEKWFYQDGSLHRHIKTHAKETAVKCDVCGKILHGSGSLHAHMRIHTGEKPFKCGQCGMCFSLSGVLRSHMRTHTGEQPFKCDKCGRFFNRSCSLKRHMRTHSGEKPFKCGKCGKCFRVSGSLHSHMLIHTGERPFKCDKCGKSFNTKGNFKAHLGTHTGEKPFKCDECGNCFSRRDHLHTHMRTHTGEKPFKCDECGKYFNRRSSVKVHMRIHNGEKPFKCGQCGKCFSESSGLYVHLRTHTGEKPFKCDQCGKCFSESGHLVRHKKIHARENL